MNVSNLKAALQAAEIVTIGQTTYTVQAVYSVAMHENNHNECISLVEAETEDKDELRLTWDEMQAMDDNCDIQIKALVDVKW